MTDCIIFTGCRSMSRGKPGYGHVYANGKKWVAHRYEWFKNHGEIPKGLFVCHRCNNKGCINVDHLYLATNQQNILDAARDGLIRNQNTGKTQCLKCGGEYVRYKTQPRRYCPNCKKASNRKTKRLRKLAAMLPATPLPETKDGQL